MKRLLHGIVPVLIMASFTAAQNVSANEQPGQFYLDAMATGIIADSDRLVDDGFAGGQLAFGYVFHPNWNVEMFGQYFALDGDKGGPDQDQTGLGLNVLNVYNREGRFSPYLIAGAGWVNTDPDIGSSQDNLQLQGGVGLTTDLGSSERWSLRTEVLYRWEDADGGNLGDVLFNIGIGYAFGSKRVAAAAPVAAAAVAAPIVAEKPVDTDSDNDGVVDRLDQCAGTPAGVIVDSVGCARDSDGDGVADGLDQCPDTIRGAFIDDRGCAIRLSGISFGFDSAELKGSATKRLDEAAAKLHSNQGINITVEGYTDSRGDAGYNQRLSERRANAVKVYLVQKGVSATRIRTVGLGAAQPVASNDTDAGRAENRRVVLKIAD